MHNKCCQMGGREVIGRSNSFFRPHPHFLIIVGAKKGAELRVGETFRSSKISAARIGDLAGFAGPPGRHS